MMYRKWHTTGPNNRSILWILRRMITAAAAAAVLCSMLVFNASAAKAEQFTDVNANEWYYFELAGAVEAGIFAGESETFFNVYGNITRAEFVTALSRLCGADVSGYQNNPFADVSQEQWFFPYICWAYENGVADGVAPTEFAPDLPISREEISKMLGSAIERVLGETLSTEGAHQFTDQDAIAPWAKEWVEKCTVLGILRGHDTGAFEPQGLATRAEAACMFYRYYSKDIEKPLLEVSGFELNFDANQDYYLVYPADFSNCRIISYNGPGALSVSVEQYAGYYPYQSKSYVPGQPLELGHGRAKVTLCITLPGGTVREYLLAFTDPNGASYSYARVRTSSSVNVREAPSTDAGIITSLVNNAQVYYLGTEGDWCRVQLLNQINGGRVGYIHKDYLKTGYAETAMPERYRGAVEALQAAHPNWQFKFVDVERDYQSYLDSLSGMVYENGGWVSASKEQIARYLDPLNSLNETDVFNFVDISYYNAATYRDEGISAVWVNESGFSKSTAVSYFMQASRSLQVTPYFITSRAAIESGYGTSLLARGQVPGYEGYYNFYGIQARDENPNLLGAQYAKSRNWNSVFRSIVEGANWFRDQYIDQGSITPYYFRYAALNGKAYMTDISAPTKDAQKIRQAYVGSGMLDTQIQFVIPVYRNMP